LKIKKLKTSLWLESAKTIEEDCWTVEVKQRNAAENEKTVDTRRYSVERQPIAAMTFVTV